MGHQIPRIVIRAKREIFVIYVQGLTHSPHVLRLSAFLIHTRGKAATTPLVTSQRTPLFSLLPLEGGAPKGRRLALEALFSLAGMPPPPRFALPKPSPLGKGDRGAVDRVLS